MPLAAGARLGPYEILSPLGAGGMGEVYRARDTRLGREVAIKVLPADLASDPERLARFEKEARSASSLNHPNIVTIHDIGSVDSVSYIAMELVRGEPLRARLLGGPLPARELLGIAVQVADGLAAAHASGIVHRDLKPENVMVTEEGRVKILDFGLAKLTAPSSDSSEETQTPTVSMVTEPGVVMGTVAYMSPEQAFGKSLDFRSDQFSFGSILYEMATGRRPFQRGSRPQTLTAIIQEDPEPVAVLNAKVPLPVRWIVERCLAKKPRDRYSSTDDLAKELATVRDHLSEAASGSWMVAEPPAARRRRWRLPAAVAGALLVAAAVEAWHLREIDYFWKSPLSGARFTRFTDWEGSEQDAAISPDGKFVAFVSDRDGPFDAWIGQVGGGEFLNLSKGNLPARGFETTRAVGFAGDGAHVWFQHPHLAGVRGSFSLWLVPMIGGTPRLFLQKGVEAAWSPDSGRISYYFPPGDRVFVADKNGEDPREIVSERPGFHNHYLTWSPDGHFIYFVRGIPPDDLDVWRIRPAGGSPERMTNHHSGVSYPVLLDGGRTLLYCATRADGGSGLFAMDVDRRIPHAVTAGIEEYSSVSASADGRRLAASVANTLQDLWTVPISEQVVDESGFKRFDLPNVRAAAPRIGPDYVLYLSEEGGARGLWKWKDGSATELWRGSDGSVPFAPGISADGSRIAFVTRRAGRHHHQLMSSNGTDIRPIAESLDVADAPSWSPDGKWIAVVANDEARHARPLYKVPVDGGPPVQLVDGATADPVWSPDGRLILYSEGYGGTVQLRAITPEKQPVAMPDIHVWYTGNRYRFLPGGTKVIIQPWRVGTRVLKSEEFWELDLATNRTRQLTSLREGYRTNSFDVSPDGKRILFDRFRANSDIVLIDRWSS
jgi:Tol biopolymer transport system component